MSHQEIPTGLDSATRQQEKDLVIDLAPDRILYHIGVNLLIILAVITKLTEETGTKLTCFPIDGAGSTLQFVKYTDSFCWQSAATTHNSTMDECPYLKNQTFVKQEQLLQSPVYIKRMIQWLPYVMLLEAFLFALPMAYWHFSLGAVLMGHLKFMRLLLESIYETLKEIPAGIYRKEAYDSGSKSFNCWREWQKRDNKQSVINGKSSTPACDSNNVPSPQDSQHNGSVPAKQSPERIDASKQPLLGTTVDFTNEKIASKHVKRRASIDSQSHTEEEKISKKAVTEIAPKCTESGKCQSMNTSPDQSTSHTEGNVEQQTEIKGIVSKACVDANIRHTSMNSDVLTHSSDQPDSTSHAEIKEEQQTETKDIVTKACANENIKLMDSNILTNSSDQHDSTIQKRNEFDNLFQCVTQPKFTERWEAIREKRVGSKSETKAQQGTNMQDRHIFSMLCYENFASMQHQPYLESVEKLSRVEFFEEMFAGIQSDNQYKQSEQDETSAGIILPLKHAILRSFCDEDNLTGCIVVKKYQIKSALTIALGAFVWMLILATFVFILLPTLESDSFLCSVPYHEKYCSMCTISGLTDVHAAFFSNWVAVTLHLVISSANLLYFKRARSRAIAHFLDDIKPLCCVALAAAYEKANRKKDDGAK